MNTIRLSSSHHIRRTAISACVVLTGLLAFTISTRIKAEDLSAFSAKNGSQSPKNIAIAFLAPDQPTPQGWMITPQSTAQPFTQLAQETVEIASLWKLFVHVYSTARNKSMPEYQCTGQVELAEQDAYCCDRKGQSIDANMALARSCSAFFAPTRLALDLNDWQAFWRSTVPQAPPWLTQAVPQAKTRATVISILTVLQAIPAAQRTVAQEALLQTVVTGRAQGTAQSLGGRWRVKTFTWRNRNGSYTGGGGGWLLDGTAVWFAARGSSANVLKQWAPILDEHTPNAALTAQTLKIASSDCVRVKYFARYPIARIRHFKSGNDAPLNQPMRGYWSIFFERGTQLDVITNDQLRLSKQTDGTLLLTGEHGLEEYVARVVEREGNAEKTQAARSLALLARTYLMQNATRDDRCYVIDDSSATQRVSAATPSVAAQQAALWSAGIVVNNIDAQYRERAEATPNSSKNTGIATKPYLAWQTAVTQSNQGMRSIDILLSVWPQLALSTLQGASECDRLTVAEQWLMQQKPRWSSRLGQLVGYETQENITVCALRAGLPYADLIRNRVYVRGNVNLAASSNDRIALAHEYLHLAFKHHPSSSDEQFIEQTARTLILGSL